MNAALEQLKTEFGMHGSSWALWDESGKIEPIIKTEEISSLIKPNIIFLGLNASILVQDAWAGFHQECRVKDSFKTQKVKRLADLLQENEFKVFYGAYMTDIIKDQYAHDSDVVSKKFTEDESSIKRNLDLFNRELDFLAKISNSNKFTVICMGNNVCEIIELAVNKGFLNQDTVALHKITHYAWRAPIEAYKERVRGELRNILKGCQLQ